MNPYYSGFSDNCSSKRDNDLPFDFAQLLAQEPPAAHVASCQPDLSPDPVKIMGATKNQGEGFDKQLYGIDFESENNELNRDDLVNGFDPDRGVARMDSCLYLERNHQVLRAEDDARCGIFEPGFDYTQLIGVLTLSVVSILSFAVIPLAWLLSRYHRVWRLRGFAFATAGSSASRTWKTQTYAPPLVATPRNRLSSSAGARRRQYQHGRRRSGRANKGG